MEFCSVAQLLFSARREERNNVRFLYGNAAEDEVRQDQEEPAGGLEVGLASTVGPADQLDDLTHTASLSDHIHAAVLQPSQAVGEA
jgi:hypothetical protein